MKNNRLGWRMAILFALAFLFVSISQAQTITFKKQGGVVREIKLEEFAKLTKSQKIKVWEPHEDKEVEYEGYDLRKILDSVYGKAWKTFGLVLFECADGYKAPVPRENIEAFLSVLAFSRPGAKFEVNNRFQNQKEVTLMPLYLVWNNLHEPQLRAEGGSNWPYQVVGIELTDFKTKFPAMGPSENAAAPVTRGFKAFQKYCMTCHKVNGDGGDKGPELNTITQRRDDKWLVSWILEPAKINPGTTMPALTQTVKSRKGTAQDIVSYLHVMNAEKAKADSSATVR